MWSNFCLFLYTIQTSLPEVPQKVLIIEIKKNPAQWYGKNNKENKTK